MIEELKSTREVRDNDKMAPEDISRQKDDASQRALAVAKPARKALAGSSTLGT